MTGCATYRTVDADKTDLFKRRVTQTQGGVQVSAAAMSREESKRVFGVPLGKKGIQPVWLEIRNSEQIPYLFFQRSVSDLYFSPDEVAYLSRRKALWRKVDAGIFSILFLPTILLMPVQYFQSQSATRKLEERLSKLAFCKFVVRSGATESGYIFVPIEEGKKEITVHLNAFGGGADKDFLLTVEVPGIEQDYRRKNLENRYADHDFVDLDANELREFSEKLSCCATNRKGNRNGDPINLVIIGNLEDVVSALIRAKWTETEALSFKTAVKTMSAFFKEESYLYSPVSALYYGGKPQDIAMQKARDGIDQRMHLRLWHTKYQLDGKTVWIGQVSRDIGVKFTYRTWNLTTHKIDPRIDDAREYVLSDLEAVGMLESVGYTKGGNVSAGEDTQQNLTGDFYFTDGLRLVAEIGRAQDSQPKFLWTEFPGSFAGNS